MGHAVKLSVPEQPQLPKFHIACCGVPGVPPPHQGRQWGQRGNLALGLQCRVTNQIPRSHSWPGCLCCLTHPPFLPSLAGRKGSRKEGGCQELSRFPLSSPTPKAAAGPIPTHVTPSRPKGQNPICWRGYNAPTKEPQAWSSSQSLMSLLGGHEHTDRKLDPWDSASGPWESQPRPPPSAQGTGHMSTELEGGLFKGTVQKSQIKMAKY